MKGPLAEAFDVGRWRSTPSRTKAPRPRSWDAAVVMLGVFASVLIACSDEPTSNPMPSAGSGGVGAAGTGPRSGNAGAEAQGVAGSVSGAAGANGGSATSGTGGTAGNAGGRVANESGRGGSPAGAPSSGGVGGSMGGVSGAGGTQGGAGGSSGALTTSGTNSGGAAGTGGSGGAAAGSAGSAGNSGAFNPCPASGVDCKVMPLGDSITDGFGTPGGYRIDLFRRARTAGQRITFVGRNMNGPGSVSVGTEMVSFPQRHEGYSGYTIDPAGGRQGISPLVTAALMQGTPHIILLHVGTNDIDLNLSVSSAPMRLGALLDRIVAGAPEALIVLAKITPLNYDAGNARVEAYNAAMAALVQSRVATGKHIVLVDMYAPFVADTAFKTRLLADQWHPSPAGYTVMANVWYEAIRSYLR